MYSKQFISVVAAALLAASALPGIGQTSGETLDMVHLGVAQLGGVARAYAGTIETDLGVPVKVWFRNARYRDDPEALLTTQARIVDDAEIVFVGMSPVAGRFEGYCLDTVTDQPYNQTVEAFRADIDAFLGELVRHADPSVTMIRVVLRHPSPDWTALWAERGQIEACAAGWMERHAQWTEAAAGHGIPVIDLTTAWMGADAKGEMPEGYLTDSIAASITPEGAKAAAELVRAVGYAPLAP